MERWREENRLMERRKGGRRGRRRTGRGKDRLIDRNKILVHIKRFLLYPGGSLVVQRLSWWFIASPM